MSMKETNKNTVKKCVFMQFPYSYTFIHVAFGLFPIAFQWVGR